MRSFFSAWSMLRVVAVALICGDATSAEYSGYLTVTTDYVYRGVSNSDGDLAAQLGGDIAFDSGFYAGLWASTIDIDSGPGRQRDLEINYYLGYGLELNNDWILNASFLAYTYPGAEGTVDYDFEEFGLSLNYRDWLWMEYSWSPDLYHSDESAWNFSLLAEWSLPNHFSLSAGAGHYDVSDLTGSDYEYWQIGISRPIGRVDIDLRYHGTSDWVPVVSSAQRADDRVVLSARLNF